MQSINMPSPAKGLGHTAPITHVTFTQDGFRLATSSYDGTVIVWDSRNPSQLQQIARLQHRRLVNAAAWNPASPTLLATASADKTVVVWKVTLDGAVDILSVLAYHTDDINSVAWLPDGRRLICVSEDGKATMWDGLNGRFLGLMVTHAGHCMMVSVSCEGLVATVGEDGMVSVFHVDVSGKYLSKKYDGSVEGCAWSHDGSSLAVARDDGYVDILSTNLSTILSVKVSSSAVRSVAWMEDDSVLVVGAYDGIVRFLSLDGDISFQFESDRVWPRSVATAPGIVAIGSFWSTPCLIDATHMTEVSSPIVPTHGPNVLMVRGRNLFVGCDSGILVEIDIDSIGYDTKVRFRVHKIGDNPILSLTTIGNHIFAGTFSGNLIRVSNTITDRYYVGSPIPALLSYGDLIIGGTYNGIIIALNSSTLEVVHQDKIHEGSIKSMSLLTPHSFVTGATDKIVAVGDLASRTPLWEHGNLVNAVATLDNDVIASASRDHTVKIGRVAYSTDGLWQVTRLQTLLGPDESIKSLTILGTNDSPFVLAGSYDFGLYSWHVHWDEPEDTLRSGGLITKFNQAISYICQIDRRTAAVASWNGKIAIVQNNDGKVTLIGEVELYHLLQEEMMSL